MVEWSLWAATAAFVWEDPLMPMRRHRPGKCCFRQMNSWKLRTDKDRKMRSEERRGRKRWSGAEEDQQEERPRAPHTGRRFDHVSWEARQRLSGSRILMLLLASADGRLLRVKGQG